MQNLEVIDSHAGGEPTRVIRAWTLAGTAALLLATFGALAAAQPAEEPAGTASAGAASASAAERFRALYTREWAWREAEFVG